MDILPFFFEFLDKPVMILMKIAYCANNLSGKVKDNNKYMMNTLDSFHSKQKSGSDVQLYHKYMF